MIGVPGIDISSPVISSIRRRSFSISGASRRRMPMLMRARGSRRVDAVHVLALCVGHHLERHLVVVAQEDRPLTVRRDLRRLPHDVDDRIAVLFGDRHEHARHEREVERHVALVAVAEVRGDVFRPLVRLGEEARGPGYSASTHRAQDLQHRVRLGQILAVRPFALEEIRNRVEPQRRRRPASSQKRMTSITAASTCGLSKFRSGWCAKKRCQ